MVAKFISDMSRVWKVTKKPSKKDYFLTLKVVLIGLLIIGLIGLVMHLIWRLGLNNLFN